MGTNATKVWNEKRNNFYSYKHDLMVKPFMKAAERNIIPLE